MRFPRLVRLGRTFATFPWQALLIVPPVLVLAVMALLALRQDRTAIEQDARTASAGLATDLGQDIGQRLGVLLSRRLAQGTPGVAIVVRGLIREPVAPLTELSPPAWLDLLTPTQRQWLDRLESNAAPNGVEAGSAARRLLASDPPAPLLAYLEYREDVAAGPEPSASTPNLGRANRRLAFAQRYPEALSPSGTPLADLALVLALGDLPTGDLPKPFLVELAFRAREHPSLLTPELLAEAKRIATTPGSPASVQAIAEGYEAATRTFACARALLEAPARLSSPTAQWIETEGLPYLALQWPLTPSVDGGAGPVADWRYIVVLSLPDLRELVGQAVGEVGSRLPSYADVRLSAAGRVLFGSEDRPTLATAPATLQARAVISPRIAAHLAAELTGLTSPAEEPTSQRSGNALRIRVAGAPPPFALDIRLRDADALYARYRQRWAWSVALVLVATSAAFLALASTWRAFRRQAALAEMQSNFVASVSHEFRAPVASVRLMAERLEGGALQEPARERHYLSLIVQECRRLSSLVENVLDFSRIDQGRKRYTFEPTDLAALVSHTVELMRPTAEQRGIALDCHLPNCDEASSDATCDAQAIQQALVNLIDNAIKHAPPGSTVRVTCEPANGHVRLAVEDEGAGIPPEDRQRIFEPFYRRGSELRRETQGIGIGLAIVRHVAEAHHGVVRVESEPGRGSRFILEFPRLDAPPARPSPSDEAGAGLV